MAIFGITSSLGEWGRPGGYGRCKSANLRVQRRKGRGQFAGHRLGRVYWGTEGGSGPADRASPGEDLLRSVCKGIEGVVGGRSLLWGVGRVSEAEACE